MRRVGRRSAASGRADAFPRAIRRGDSRRDRFDRGAAHLHLEPARQRPSWLQRPARPWIRGKTPRRARRSGRARRNRQPDDQGRLDVRVLLESARVDQGHDRRALDPNRRSLLPGRGRVLLVLRAFGRHAQGRRHLGQPRGAGAHAARAPGRPRLRASWDGPTRTG